MTSFEQNSRLLQRIKELELENEILRGKISNDQTTIKEFPKIDSNFSLDEYKRYGRQMIVPEFGSLSSQIKLSDSIVLVVGAGGLGSPALQYLSAAGIGSIGIIDDDIVDTSNLHRQIIHSTSTVGEFKCESAKSFITKLNPHVHVTTYPTKLSNENAFEIIEQYDLVLDCTDHPAIRYLINDVCVLLGKTIVSGSGLKSDGQFTILNFENIGPCYRCFYPQPPNPSTVTSCSDGGVIGPAIGLVGTAMAMEAIKILTKFYTKDNFKPFLASYSAYPNQQIRTFKMRPKQENCLVCGRKKSITKEQIKNGGINYVEFCGKVVIDPIDEKYRISVQEYNDKIKNKQRHTLIDVRPKEQYHITNLPGSINIEWDPTFRKLDSLEEYMDSINKTDDIYLICRFGNDSQLAAKKLIDMGYKNVKELKGGLNKWTDEIDQNIPKY
ncbi:cnxF [Candida pseudojiufengensis]|uniref:cnxF n=1 Tax=Candida pseudojiufengensis TaxID=497109 RepID=UPI0022246883|nr:cnxF [Candida pseudojiufengensis]KAI5963758.1 cnxF [Candida pseudojiufengensis]